MADRSKIEWTEATWNPVTGCTKVSPGCDNCYAERITERFHGRGSFETVQLHPGRLDMPLRWRKPRRVFVNSMSDLFHERVPDQFIARVFAVMAQAPQHVFQVLTKRHGRMRSLLSRVGHDWSTFTGVWPLPNVWLGVSVENQHWADIRIPALLETPAAVRWLSCEPLLGPVGIERYLWLSGASTAGPFHDWKGQRVVGGGIGGQTVTFVPSGDIHWVVVGGESGPGARPMHLGWARSLRDQCIAARVPFFFKQWGEWVPESMWLHNQSAPAAFLSLDGTMRPLVNGKPTSPPMARGQDITVRRVGKKRAGRMLDGRTWDEYPEMVNA